MIISPTQKSVGYVRGIWNPTGGDVPPPPEDQVVWFSSPVVYFGSPVVWSL